MLPRNRSLLLVALAVTTLPGCVSWSPSVWVEDSRTFRLPADSVERVEVETHNGGIHAEAPSSGGEEVVVVASIRAGGETEEDASACLDAIAIDFGIEDGVVTTKARYSVSKKSTWGMKVSYQVTMPASAGLNVVTHNGGIDVQGIEGGLDLETHNGPVTVNGAKATWRVRTHNGRIEVAGAPESLELVSHNGGVVAAIAGTGPLEGKVETHNGSIRIDLLEPRDVAMTGVTNNGRIKVSDDFTTEVSERR
ncbi:MAG: hypothetical protein AAF488_18080, partial [Planctomycetota bacterium]